MVWVADWWEKRGGGGYTHRKKQLPTRGELAGWVKDEAERLKNEAKTLRRAEKRGDNVVTLSNLSPIERAALAHAVETIRRAGGKLESISKAASVYASAYLGGAKTTVSELLAEHLAHLEKLGKRPPTIRDRRLYLAPFVERHGESLAATVTRKQCEEWVFEADTPSKQASRRRALHALYSFAQRRGTVPANPVGTVEKPNERPPDTVDIFTPEEAEGILRAAQEREPRLVPYFAVGMFAGLRPQNELARLNWGDINLESGMITVTRSTSKTDRVRHVPIQPNLKAWLESVPESMREGKLFYSKRAFFKVLGREWPQGDKVKIRAAKEKAAAKRGHTLPGPKPEPKPTKETPLRWGADIMRHSFCTFRQAVLRDIGKLCFEAGNTPSVAAAHYLNPRVKDAEVKAFWKIMPKAAGKEMAQ